MFSAPSKSQRKAIERALVAVTGAARPDAAARLSGGLSGAGVYEVSAAGRVFVLRVDGEQDPLRSREAWYGCMAAAGEAGVTPRVLYADPANGVAIVERLASRPLAEAFGGSRAALIAEAASLVRRLHGLPIGPPTTEYMDGMAVLVARFVASGLLPHAKTAEAFARFAQLAQAYRSDPADLVLAHNDLNGRNLIFAGERLWLIDWEAAFRADRFIDLAGLANAFTRGPEEERQLLLAYFGGEPSEVQRARLRLMRALNDLFYALVMLNGAARERLDPAAAQAIDPPPFTEIRAGLDAGRFSLETWEARVAYGKSRLALALEGMCDPAFAEALARIA